MPPILCSNFNLKHTLESGQFFRYELRGEWYYVVTRGRVFRVRQEGGVLHYDGASARFVRHFFSLDEDYSRIRRELRKDRTLSVAVRRYPGLRIIRQDPWECTLSFICSQFSNIRKIRKNLELIAQNFGKPVVFRGYSTHTIPNPGDISDFSKLKKCALGYRAKYVHGTNRLVDDAFFAGLEKLPYESAKKKLLELPGIGEKVADCILLFSLGKTEAFPVDVWMERVVTETYLNGQKLSLPKMSAWGRERWGPLAGYAQQYLYHARRLR